MKAKINHENKAKFFALYWGQKVIKDNACQLLYVSSNINLEHDSWYLILKPLSSISDEDAIEVAKINTSIDWNNGLKPSVWTNSFGYKVVSNGCGLIQKYGQTLICEPYLSLHQFQLLTSKGYALPWMGLSVDEMVEAGWIKLIE